VQPYLDVRGFTDDIVLEGKRLLQSAFEVVDPAVTITA